MTLSKKSKPNKSSQETQSPATKLFKKLGRASESSLMKLFTSDPPKLIFLFAIACVFVVIVGVLNWCSCKTYAVPSGKLLDERRKRRSYGDPMEDDGKPWEASTLKLMDGFSELLGPDTGESNVYDGKMDNFDNTSPDLTNILDPVKVNAAYSSSSLRDFYRKLLKTDIQIKNLRKGLANHKRDKINNYMDFNPLRTKRSLKIFKNATRTQMEPYLHKQHFKNLNIYYTPSLDIRAIKQNIDRDIKENSNIGAVPDSNPVAEKTKELKMLHQYTTNENNIKVAKYPWWMDTKTKNPQHEIKHSNNQNSEKLDDLLDLMQRLLTKQVPETTPNMLDSVLNGEEKNVPVINVNNYSANSRKEKIHSDDRIKLKPASKLYTTQQEEVGGEVPYSFREKSQRKQTNTASNASDMKNIESVPQQTEAKLPELSDDRLEYMMTIATISSVGPVFKNLVKDPVTQRLYFPKQRRLLQHKDDGNDEDEDDEHDSNYEDQTKEPWDREKRMVKPMELGLEDKPVSNPALDLPKINSPNWKGPMPLYHDELYMIKAATKMPTGKTADTKNEISLDTTIKTHSYTKYTEDNKNNNYDQLLEMAQAYSDYGVLDGKKEAVENNKTPEDMDKLIMLEKGHKISEPKTNRGIFFGNHGLNNNAKIFPYHNLPINKDNRAKAVQGINDSKSLLKHNKPKMYCHHKRSLKSVETEDPNINTTVGNKIEPNNNDTVKLVEIENSTLKGIELGMTSMDNNKITNLSKIDKSNELDKIGNRTVVKRSVHGNTIFWNDLYDDEYGVKDPLENEMKDKSSVKYNDLIAKSENWIGAKFKLIANNMKERKYHWRDRSKQNKHIKDLGNKINVTKRAINDPEYSNKNSGNQSKLTFEALTAKMKKVLHEAAKAMQETTSRETRSEHGQSTSLMQQLVGLMSELVDIQVQQKTCVQLPDDLRNFLAWLTNPDPQNDESNEINLRIDSTSNTSPITIDFPNIDYDVVPANSRSDYQDTIRDVKDLIQQYDEMSEKDKTKMSGVREYLQYQLNFLNKQMSNFNEFDFPVMYPDPSIRKRRQLPKSLNDKIPPKRKTHIFHKYFDRKRTKSTVHEEIEKVTRKYIIKNRKNVKGKVNDTFKKEKGVLNNNGENEKTALNIKSLHGNDMKRNLHDVYYSALARANANSTTVKYNGA